MFYKTFHFSLFLIVEKKIEKHKKRKQFEGEKRKNKTFWILFLLKYSDKILLWLPKFVLKNF